MIVVDTGAILGLVDRDSEAHSSLRRAFDKTGSEWVVPWAVLPEVDHLLTRRFGRETALAFLNEVEAGTTAVEWGEITDVRRALELDRTYADLDLGLTDTVVMAIAERLEARAIVTLDLRDFAPVELSCRPELWPRDLATP